MNNIKAFENFSNDPYLWPDAKFWIEDLYPEEICFLGIYSDIVSNSTRKDTPPIQVDSSNEEYQLDYDDGKVSFEIFYEIPSKNNKNCSLSVSIEASGHFTPVIPETRYQPEEGGEPILDSIEIESAYYLDSEENIEVSFGDASYDFKSDIITRKDLIDAIRYSAYTKIDSINHTMTLKKPELPNGLIEKCEEIRKKNPDVIKGHRLIRRSI